MDHDDTNSSPAIAITPPSTAVETAASPQKEETSVGATTSLNPEVVVESAVETTSPETEQAAMEIKSFDVPAASPAPAETSIDPEIVEVPVEAKISEPEVPVVEPSSEKEAPLEPSDPLVSTSESSLGKDAPMETTSTLDPVVPAAETSPDKEANTAEPEPTPSEDVPATQGSPPPPQSPPQALSEKQPEHEQPSATQTSDDAPPPEKTKKKGKKRPPGKRRESEDDEDNENNNTSRVITPTGSFDQPPPSAAVRGSVVHEVVEWQAERSFDAKDDDDDDLAFYAFDGYTKRSSLTPYENISAEDCPDAGCYLLFDSQGGGKLVLHYSKTRVAKALAFYAPGPDHSIAAFKFTRNHGRVELIGNCASGLTGRRNYFSGVCQFVRAAKDVNGTFWIFSTKENEKRPGLEVDVYIYLMSSSSGSSVRNYSVRLPEDRPCCVSEIDAVACLPKHADFFSNVTTDMSKWLDDGNSVGATIQLQDGKKPLPESTEGLFIPGLTVVEKAPPQQEIPSLDALSQEEAENQMGCYLVYDADGSKLIQHYSKTRVADAICFFSPGPGQKIPGFKFSNKQGRNELIGNCSGGVAGRKNYFNGVCQFIRAAKAIQGTLTIFPRRKGQSGLDVEMYAYTQRPEAGAHQTIKLTERMVCNVSNISAVACLPKHSEFFDGLTTDLIRWVEEGGKVGAALQV